MNKNNDYSLDELSNLLVQLGKKKHGMDCAYPFALGTIIGMVDFNLKYRPNDLQKVINESYEFTQKELAAA